MLTEEEIALIARATRPMQIIVGSLSAGVVMFAAAAVFIVSHQAGPPAGETLVTYLAIAFALVSLPLALVIPGVIVRSQRTAALAAPPTQPTPSSSGHSSDIERELRPMLAHYQTALIVRSALLEGAAFFCLVAYLIEHRPLSLCGAGGLLLLILSGIPTRAKIESAVESERIELQQIRQLEPNNAR
jgi:hypothetical protein